MKKNIFKKAACMAGAVVITLAMTTSFLGCSSDSEETVPTVQEESESFKDALRSLAQAQRESCRILFSTMQTRAADEFQREDPDSVAIAVAIARADSILTVAFDSTLLTVDLTADLDFAQLNALNITPREAELYAADPYAFQDYAKTAKTPEFCRIYNSVLNGISATPTVETIISNNNLSMNEQLTLVMATTVCDEIMCCLDDYRVVVNHNNPAEKACMKQYTIDTGLCMAGLLAALGTAVGSVAATGGASTPVAGIGLGMAGWRYYKCLRSAKNDLELCRYRYQSH